MTGYGTMSHPRLRVESYDDLENYEAAILERIATMPHGGNLFLLHPFMLLEDVGVDLVELFKRALIEERPALATLSALPYAALRRNPGAEQAVVVRLKGLFKRGGHSRGRKS